ncbi:2-succinyl-6-hydroxy-2,4-cyclohexadiene-1-carboxylate synthase [Robertmurraya andreesenii]|uniref:Putative 2-succinyl-6-hydroxy-2,4-cyclohexadiene-1-carboxylate synthase n=1 Tax=Anoxybacillus andreesenii TaxID=1325932 RepID=A0ABT9VA48_9BACL|nr:2-succinyl-6-hydroxy-2,4-cyclohexadiene-1-carboxylate synthase [Robertmurraya andreesenii]MDQ0157838.1 2-succinyl-6-hydroxy-2,4-cyclohexadiene-1-carboxylate synthase [Robertmurraya andreesenii]
MRHVIDGIRYNVDTYGDGFPVILLHGFTGNMSMWQPFYEKWGKHSKLIAVDIIGHGKTEMTDQKERYRMLSVVDDIFLIMEKLKIQKADFVGYSMGGRLALSFAAKYPTKVRKLVLESASPGLASVEERKERMKQDEKLADFIEEKGIEEFVDYWENISLFESQKRLPSEVQKSQREQRLQNSAKGLANSLRGMGTGAQPSWWGELENIKMSTLLITGSLDTKFCLIAEKMQERLENSQWVNVEGSGHAIHVENCEKFGTIISGFLSKT